MKTKSKVYMTPKGTVFAHSAEEAANMTGYPVDAVFLAKNGFIAMPERCKHFYPNK